jgi:predicted ATP-grasp superfamily ATP-dependent carboligase
MRKVLILDAHLRAALACTRSLGRKEINIECVSNRDFAIGSFSKYCTRHFACHDPETHPDIFREELMRIAREGMYDCIIPNSTQTALLIATHCDELSHYTNILSPNLDVFLQAFDKEAVVKRATGLGIASPKTYTLKTLPRSSDGPHQLIIKPRYLHGAGILLCDSSDQVPSLYKRMCDRFGACYIQDFIPNGGEYGVYVLLNRQSALRAVTIQRRIRSISSNGGISTLRETVPYDSRLVDPALRLLQSLQWVGPAMVEFRIDAMDGVQKFIEVNLRFWGSLQLSINAGMDFPYLFYQIALEGDVKPSHDYQANVQCRWLLGDVTNFMQTPHKLRHLHEFLQPTAHYDIESLRDPLPMVINPIMVLKYLPKRKKDMIQTIAGIK